MRSARLAAAVGTVLGLLLLWPGSAHAGGPTSVIIVSQSLGTTASLYVTDDDYGVLARALGEQPVAPTSDDAPTWQPNPGTPGITATWLVHDVQVWRVDHIQVGPDGEVWVHTKESFDPADDAGDGVWHRAPRPDELLALMERLGVLDGDAPAVAPGLMRDSDQPATAHDTPAPMAGSTTASGAGSWTWPALAGGIVVGFLGDRLVRRRRDQQERGGWELVDAPYRDDSAGSP